MTIIAKKPTSMKQAFAIVQDQFSSYEDDTSHLSREDICEMNREFAMAVHYIARPNRPANRFYRAWLVDKLKEDFPWVDLYDADGNVIED